MIQNTANQVSPYIVAVFGFIGVIVGGLISSIVQYQLMSRRIKADVALAQQKFDLELKASRLKRKQELAEELLSGFYEFKDMMRYVRQPMSFGHEGKSRQRGDHETDADAKAKDTYFVQLERLDQNREKMANFFSRQNRAMAWFGQDIGVPFEQVTSVLNETTSAASILVRTAGQHGLDLEFVRKMEAKIWWIDEQTDPLIARLAAANARIEGICRPILSEPQ